MRTRTISIRAAFLLAVLALPLAGEGKSNTVINGSLSSSLDLLDNRTFPGDGFQFLYGWINVANLRLKSTVNESLSVLLSGTFTALNGIYAGFASSGFIAELERLSFRVKTDVVDVEAGLIRIPRGYGYIFSPLEILNPKDTLNAADPSGRPKGKWGIHSIFYPQDMWKLECFGLTPDDPMALQGWGSKLGAATTFSVDSWNFDFLYTLYLPAVPFESNPTPPDYRNNDFTQVAGIAFKADVVIGLFVEALYRFEHRMFRTGSYYGKPFRGYEGLEAAAGIDYTFSDQNLYLMCEYLFYGPGLVDWQEPSLDPLVLVPGWRGYSLAYARHDYLFLMLRYSPEQDLSFSLSALAGLDDLSALVTAFCQYEIVQGLSFQASVLVPVDRKTFNAAAQAGEWGSSALGFYQMTRLGVKVKF